MTGALTTPRPVPNGRIDGSVRGEAAIYDTKQVLARMGRMARRHPPPPTGRPGLLIAQSFTFVVILCPHAHLPAHRLAREPRVWL